MRTPAGLIMCQWTCGPVDEPEPGAPAAPPERPTTVPADTAAPLPSRNCDRCMYWLRYPSAWWMVTVCPPVPLYGMFWMVPAPQAGSRVPTDMAKSTPPSEPRFRCSCQEPVIGYPEKGL